MSSFGTVGKEGLQKEDVNYKSISWAFMNTAVFQWENKVFQDLGQNSVTFVWKNLSADVLFLAFLVFVKL